MDISRVRRIGVVVLASVSLLPAVVSAQSAFTGVVRDTSGAVLPGVTVEAASPALIEKSDPWSPMKTARYRLVDLRPGVYTLTFTLDGFSSVKREGIELPSDFTMTVNTEMKVGALEETLTVTGVGARRRRAEHDQVAGAQSRDVLDADSDRPHDSGDGAADHRRLAEHPGRRRLARDAADLHVRARHELVADDGAGRRPDGQRPRRRRCRAELLQQLDEPGDGLHDERRVGGRVGRRRAAQHDPERRRQHRSTAASSPAIQNKSFQTDNLTDELKARGLKSADGIDKLSNFEASVRRTDQEGQGLVLPVGAHVPPRHAAGRRRSTRDGSPGVDPQSINSAQARIIWQISQKNKLSVYNDRIGKNRGAAMTAGFDPATASQVWNSPIYTTGAVKLTSTVTNRILRRRRRSRPTTSATTSCISRGHLEAARHAGVVHAPSTSRTLALGTQVQRRA